MFDKYRINAVVWNNFVESWRRFMSQGNIQNAYILGRFASDGFQKVSTECMFARRRPSYTFYSIAIIIMFRPRFRRLPNNFFFLEKNKNILYIILSYVYILHHNKKLPAKRLARGRWCSVCISVTLSWAPDEDVCLFNVGNRENNNTAKRSIIRKIRIIITTYT